MAPGEKTGSLSRHIDPQNAREDVATKRTEDDSLLGPPFVRLESSTETMYLRLEGSTETMFVRLESSAETMFVRFEA